jgi:hypothetical protein
MFQLNHCPRLARLLCLTGLLVSGLAIGVGFRPERSSKVDRVYSPNPGPIPIMIQANTNQRLNSLFEGLQVDPRFSKRSWSASPTLTLLQRVGVFLGIVTVVNAQNCPGFYYINNSWPCICIESNFQHATPDGGYMEMCNGQFTWSSPACFGGCEQTPTTTCSDGCA